MTELNIRFKGVLEGCAFVSQPLELIESIQCMQNWMKELLECQHCHVFVLNEEEGVLQTFS